MLGKKLQECANWRRPLQRGKRGSASDLLYKIHLSSNYTSCQQCPTSDSNQTHSLFLNAEQCKGKWIVRHLWNSD
ncbi:unnamed protein product [Caretta caretta]